MLNKKKAKTWVKVVAWLLAGSFALSMTLLLVIPSGPSSAPTTAPAGTTPIQTVSPADAAAGAAGQGDLALKNGQIEQAAGFYEKAYQLDSKDKAIKSKLRDAYEKYLKDLPNGPKAESVKAALADLK
jgi:hypothetical protein